MKSVLKLAAPVSLLATPALAHHPLAGAPMETLAHGVLSGVGHPVLGFDHLFFILIIGVAAAFTGNAAKATGAYIVAMLVGCLTMSFGIGLPAKEIVIALSLLLVGGMVMRGKDFSLPMAIALFAGFGLFHGSAFGDTIAGQEAAMGPQVLIGYLVGLGVTQMMIAMAAGLVARKVWKAADMAALQNAPSTQELWHSASQGCEVLPRLSCVKAML